MCTILFSLAIHMYTDHSLFTGLAYVLGVWRKRVVLNSSIHRLTACATTGCVGHTSFHSECVSFVWGGSKMRVVLNTSSSRAIRRLHPTPSNALLAAPSTIAEKPWQHRPQRVLRHMRGPAGHPDVLDGPTGALVSAIPTPRARKALGTLDKNTPARPTADAKPNKPSLLVAPTPKAADTTSKQLEYADAAPSAAPAPASVPPAQLATPGAGRQRTRVVRPQRRAEVTRKRPIRRFVPKTLF